MNVYIQVTAADVAKGQRKSCVACPIALAINRALKPGYHASLEKRTISLNYGSRSIPQQVGLYPAGLTPFIIRYDLTGEMSPFTFAMEIAERLIGGL